MRSGSRPFSASLNAPFEPLLLLFFAPDFRVVEREGARPRELFARVDCVRLAEDRDLLEEDLDLVATVWPTLVEDHDRVPSFRALCHRSRAKSAA